MTLFGNGFIADVIKLKLVYIGIRQISNKKKCSILIKENAVRREKDKCRGKILWRHQEECHLPGTSKIAVNQKNLGERHGTDFTS